MKQFWKTILIFIIGITTTGCMNFGKNQSSLSFWGNGDGRSVIGQVIFHDTNLTLDSTIALGQEIIYSETGVFHTYLTPGSYDYTITTLLGNYRGTVTYDATSQGLLSFIVPAFPGWSAHLFNKIVVNENIGETIRWPKGKTIRVWIEPPGFNPLVQDRHRNMAWNSFLEWQSVLYNTITFELVNDPMNAEITLRFGKIYDPTGAITAGKCDRTWDVRTGYIKKGSITISTELHGYYLHDEIGFYRHEIGHCIGLNHSDNPNHLMHPNVGPSNNRITSVEQNLVRLLYSIQPRTPYIGSTMRVQPLAQTDAFEDEDETFLFTETLYTILHHNEG